MLSVLYFARFPFTSYWLQLCACCENLAVVMYTLADGI